MVTKYDHRILSLGYLLIKIEAQITPYQAILTYLEINLLYLCNPLFFGVLSKYGVPKNSRAVINQLSVNCTKWVWFQQFICRPFLDTLA